VQLEGFQDDVRRLSFQIVKETIAGKLEIETAFLGWQMQNARMHLVPVVEGAANKGVGKLVLGIALIGVALAMPAIGGMIMSGAGTTTLFGISAGTIGMAGVGLALGGAAMLLAPQPKMNTGGDTSGTDSFIFSGANNNAGQGFCIPVVIGEVMVGSNGVASRITTVDFTVPIGTVIDIDIGYDPNEFRI
jgi:predicted phage tail protein